MKTTRGFCGSIFYIFSFDVVVLLVILTEVVFIIMCKRLSSNKDWLKSGKKVFFFHILVTEANIDVSFLCTRQEEKSDLGYLGHLTYLHLFQYLPAPSFEFMNVCYICWGYTIVKKEGRACWYIPVVYFVVGKTRAIKIALHTYFRILLSVHVLSDLNIIICINFVQFSSHSQPEDNGWKLLLILLLWP